MHESFIHALLTQLILKCRRKCTFCAGTTTKTRRRSHRRTKPKDLLIPCAVSGNMTCVHCASSTPIRCCAMFYSVDAFRNDPTPRPLPTLLFSWSLVLLRPRGPINSSSWSERERKGEKTTGVASLPACSGNMQGIDCCQLTYKSVFHDAVLTLDLGSGEARYL